MKTTALQALALAGAAAFASGQVPAGPEFRVNTFTPGHQMTAHPAMEPNGDFVIVWASAFQDGSHYGVFGQRFAASGLRRGAEFQINTHTSGGQSYPALAIRTTGEFVVVWSNWDGFSSDRSIQGRRYDRAGNPVGDEFQVSAYTSGLQVDPRVGVADDGRAVVVWLSDSVDGSGMGIAGRRLDASGIPIGSEFVVNTYTTGFQTDGDVAVAADGNFVAVWHDDNLGRDGSGSAVFGQRYDASGNRVGGEFQVNTYTPGYQDHPSVSASEAGGFVVSWYGQDGSGSGIFARRFDASGNGLGSDFVVNTSTTGRQYTLSGAVAHDTRGNFIVTWMGMGNPPGDPDDSFAHRFSASGARRASEFQTNTYSPGDQTKASVASDSVGNFIVTWESFNQDGATWGIFAQRYGGLGPAALAVDIAGNRVLEPGETVDVRPSWWNFNGGAQTFGGTLTNITGPAGATYAITDPAGNYGAVPDGVTAQCTDCYAVSVSNPATRPALHWDASAVESIVPDAHGQQKQWLLHVGLSFNDVPPATSPFYRFVETLLHHGITAGCSATQYCPVSSTSREQMAVFVLVAKERAGYLPPDCGATPMFADVPASSPFCRWIEELARRGVVSGCGGGNYCPDAPVTREQMAVFVLRTLDPALAPPACGAPVYNDVPATNPFCRWIEELTRRGVVSGCGGGNYCPTAAVTRDQMGVFISVTFGLTLYGP